MGDVNVVQDVVEPDPSAGTDEGLELVDPDLDPELDPEDPDAGEGDGDPDGEGDPAGDPKGDTSGEAKKPLSVDERIAALENKLEKSSEVNTNLHAALRQERDMRQSAARRSKLQQQPDPLADRDPEDTITVKDLRAKEQASQVNDALTLLTNGDVLGKKAHDDYDDVIKFVNEEIDGDPSLRDYIIGSTPEEWRMAYEKGYQWGKERMKLLGLETVKKEAEAEGKKKVVKELSEAQKNTGPVTRNSRGSGVVPGKLTVEQTGRMKQPEFAKIPAEKRRATWADHIV